jgi:glycosyltransferase involved in cell wall biosynthesis
MGNGSERFARSLAESHPELQDRVHATGLLSDAALSHHLSACDLMLQPYPDGLSSRRTSLMNVLEHGIAVVSNTGHLTEDFWPSSNIAGFGSSGDLATHCIRLLNDRAARAQTAQSGLALYRARFDWPRIIAKVIARGTRRAHQVVITARNDSR